MPVCIVALSSRMGAGKSTLARALAEEFCWPRVSFGDYVRGVARDRGMDESLPTLQNLGEVLVEADAGSFAAAVLSSVNWKSGAVVDGIRHVEVLDAIRRVVSPLPVFLIYVHSEESSRIRRLLERGMTHGEIQAADAGSTEAQVKIILRDRADLHVSGTSDIAKTVKEISEWLRSKTSQ